MTEQFSCSVRLRAFLPFVLTLPTLFVLAGCTSKGAQTPPSQSPFISVAMTQTPPTSLVVGTSAQVSATVASEIANAGVTG